MSSSKFTTVFTAAKGSYGAGFFGVYDSLEKLLIGIVKHEIYFEIEAYSAKYNELSDSVKKTYNEKYGYVTYELDETKEFTPSFALIEECIKNGKYRPIQIELHDSEKIEFEEYDGTSYPYVAKKKQTFHSKTKNIKLEFKDTCMFTLL